MSSTIDAKHTTIIRNFNQKKKEKIELLNEYNKHKEELKNFKLKNKRIITDEEYETYISLKEKIENLRKKIEYIDENKESIDYFLNNSNILEEYYTLKKKNCIK